MKLLRVILAATILAGFAGVAYVGQVGEPAGFRLADAAEKLLGSLSADQKAKLLHGFDDKERLNWHFVPKQDAARKATRRGLALEEMTAEQKEAARNLLKAGTSSQGYVQATTIMSLEAILHDLEKGGQMVRNPDWYFFAVFGTPSKTGRWGWRVEGHHLSLNFVVDGGRIVASTPAFFGANPATVKGGERKGLRTLGDAEDALRDLLAALDQAQRKIAHQAQHFPEIGVEVPRPKVGPPVGLPAAQMTDKQQQLLKLLQTYTQRMPAEVAEAELAALKKAGLDKIHFAYSGEIAPGKEHTYRIHGPTFRVEFLNRQPDGARNPANHIHSVWRNTEGDFGVGG
jgi:hypothetical protein